MDLRRDYDEEIWLFLEEINDRISSLFSTITAPKSSLKKLNKILC
jgi:hypothetical protein